MRNCTSTSSLHVKELVLKNLTIVKVWNYYVFDKLEVPNSVIASILTPNFFSYKVGNCALENEH